MAQFPIYEEEKVVWMIIAQLVQFHASSHPSYKSLAPGDSVSAYFPVSREEAFNPKSEHANRWAAVLWDAIENVNRVFGKNLKYDFLVLEEWSMFETLGDFSSYMMFLLKNRQPAAK